jgi:hypothetical protein
MNKIETKENRKQESEKDRNINEENMMMSEVTTLPEMSVRQNKKSEVRRKVTGISERSLLKSEKTR